MSYSPVLFRRLFQRKEPYRKDKPTLRVGTAGIEPAKGVVKHHKKEIQ